MIAKCLSVKQPWASLITSGRKTLEIRTWATKYRGPLVVVSSQAADLGWLSHHPDGPRGAALCVVDLVDCRPCAVGDAVAACCPVAVPSEWAWVLANPRPLPNILTRGRLSLYDPTPEIREALASLGIETRPLCVYCDKPATVQRNDYVNDGRRLCDECNKLAEPGGFWDFHPELKPPKKNRDDAASSPSSPG